MRIRFDLSIFVPSEEGVPMLGQTVEAIERVSELGTEYAMALIAKQQHQQRMQRKGARTASSSPVPEPSAAAAAAALLQRQVLALFGTNPGVDKPLHQMGFWMILHSELQLQF